MTANASVVAHGLVKRIGTCSPLAAGVVAGAGSVVALYAAHACIEGQLESLPGLSLMPTIEGCHCWLIGIAGFFVGILCALFVGLVAALLEPLIALLAESLIATRRPYATITFLMPGPSVTRAHGDPLARRLAGRAPPLASA